MTLKIVVTMTFAERLGGCERFFHTFLERADRDRFELIPVFHGHGPLVAETAALGLRTHVIETGRIRDPVRGTRAVGRTWRLLRAERPDLILSWFTKAHVYTAPAAVGAGLRGRLVWFQHTLPGGTDLDRVATALPARAILASSEAGAREQERIRPRRPTRVVLPGIEEPHRASSEELMALRTSLGIGASALVGVIGRLQSWKQQHLVVEAVARLREEGRDVHGLIVGGDAFEADPGYEPFLRRFVAERGLQDAITFTGHVEDALPYIQLLDVLVNSSDHEPFGIVLLEAMALEVPAVAFDSDGGPPEILDHGRAGLLARPGGSEDLAVQIGRLLDEPDLKDATVRRGRRRFEEHFTAERMTEAMERTLSDLASAR